MRVAFIRHFAAVYQGYNGTEKMYFVWILTLLIISNNGGKCERVLSIEWLTPNR